jgi:hypothetical protein
LAPNALVTKNKRFKSDMSEVVGMSAVPCAVAHVTVASVTSQNQVGVLENSTLSRAGTSARFWPVGALGGLQGSKSNRWSPLLKPVRNLISRNFRASAKIPLKIKRLAGTGEIWSG